MNKRQPPIVRAGSGDSHEARIAVLEQRFSDDMQARCSWCNQVACAKEGEWLEVIISTPGTGVRPAHVFRCLGCEAAPQGFSGGIVAVPSGGRRPGQSPPPAPVPSRHDESAAAAVPTKAAAERGRSGKTAGRPPRENKAKKGRARGGTTDGEAPRPERRPRKPSPSGFPGGLSPAP